MDFINGYGLSIFEWVLVAVAAFMVGFSKTGISGVAMLAIPILAGIFGGKESTGILLPMLIAGDIFGYAALGRRKKMLYSGRMEYIIMVGYFLGG